MAIVNVYYSRAGSTVMVSRKGHHRSHVNPTYASMSRLVLLLSGYKTYPCVDGYYAIMECA